MTKQQESSLGRYRRMTKSQLAERIHRLQAEAPQQTELQLVLHELEVHQIELEMQNRELRDSHQALEESLDRYVNLYDFAPTGYLTLNAQGVIKDINLTMAGMFGVERRWLIGRTLPFWILPEDKELFRQHMKRCNAEEGPITTVLRAMRRDKTVIWIEIFTSRSKDQENGEICFKVAITDITARKMAEEERDRFFDLSSDLLCLAGTNGYFKRLNSGWETALGYSRTELLSQPFLNFVHPDDRAATLAEMQKLQQSENSVGFQNRFMKKDRSVVWLDWTTVKVGEVYYSVARDCTKQVSEKINSENEYNWLRELIEAIPAPMALVEAGSGRIISRSSGISKLMDSMPGEFSYSTQDAFLCEDADGKRVPEENLPRMRAARGEELNGEQVVWRTPDSKTNLLIFSRNILPKYGRPGVALILFQDVTPIKTAEQSLLEAVTKLEREREVREIFVTTLTHDLRTPLAAIKMGSQLILKLPEELRSDGRLIDRILNNVDQMDQMIHDLLDANRISAGEDLPLKLERVELVGLVQKALDVLCGIYGDRFVLNGPEELQARLDPMGIWRVIVNLCTNGVKYGDPNSPVTVSIRAIENKISLSVHNEGKAIPIGEQEILFNPFQRAASAQASGKKGWGIGLFLVRGIVESHGGNVRINSSEGQGTTFTLELPS